MIAETLQERFVQKKKYLIIRMLVISTTVIFAIETLLMFTLEYYLALPQPWVFFLDGFILVICLLPLNYLYVTRPLSKEMEEHYHADVELVNSQEMIEGFFSINDTMIAYMDAKFNFIRVNHAYAEANLHEPRYYPGKNHFELFPDEDNLRIFKNVVATGNAFNVLEKPFEYPEIPERGTTYWDWSLLPIKNTEGRVIALILALNDVTDRKTAQLALVDSERRFRAVFNQTFQHIVLLDPAGQILLSNQTVLTATGLKQTDIQGLSLWQAPWWERSAERIERIKQAVHEAASGTMVRAQTLIHCTEGEIASMDATLKPLIDEDNRVVLLIYEARDITRLVQASEALQRSEDEIRRLYEAEKHAHHLTETLLSAGRDLTVSLNTRKVQETLLDHLFKVVPYDSAHIFQLDQENCLTVSLARGEENWAHSERLSGRDFEVTEFSCLQKILSGCEVFIVPDTAAFTCPTMFLNHNIVRSWLGVPLMAGDHMIGICSLEHGSCDFFTEDHIIWAKAIIMQGAVAIQNAWLYEQVRDNREQLQALSRRLVQVQELERQYIARELHDEAGQALSSIMVGLRLIEQDSASQEAVVTRCQDVKHITDVVLENIHRLAINLRPATLDHLGLVAALRQHAAWVSQQHSLEIEFKTLGTIGRLPGDHETALYRIVQEALTNVVRHARATRVEILLEHRGEHLILVVEDNGIGFDPQIPKVGQLGLLGIQERANMLGGTITVESSPEQGTVIFLEVPCPFESW